MNDPPLIDEALWRSLGETNLKYAFGNAAVASLARRRYLGACGRNLAQFWAAAQAGGTPSLQHSLGFVFVPDSDVLREGVRAQWRRLENGEPYDAAALAVALERLHTRFTEALDEAYQRLGPPPDLTTIPLLDEPWLREALRSDSVPEPARTSQRRTLAELDRNLGALRAAADAVAPAAGAADMPELDQQLKALEYAATTIRALRLLAFAYASQWHRLTADTAAFPEIGAEAERITEATIARARRIAH
jgi:hypothetical protein